MIQRVFSYTKPYAALRNALILLVVTRAIQTAARHLGDRGGDQRSDRSPGCSGHAARCRSASSLLAGFTEVCFVFRMRLALRLGEAVVHDLRNQIYGHLLTLADELFQAHSNRSFDRPRHLGRGRGARGRSGRRVREHGAGRQHADQRRCSCSITTGSCFWSCSPWRRFSGP